MVTLKRLGAILLALLLFLFKSTPSNGQASEKVQPLFQVQGAAQKGVSGYTPAQVRRGYGFDQLANQGEGQTIAIIEAFDDPNIEADLAFFNATFGLPQCNSANPCFKKVIDAPTTPPVSEIWSFETALDVEWAHAIAPKATILLVEAKSDQLSDLLHAVDVAVTLYDAKTVSMSWGLGEITAELVYDSHFVRPNVTFFASAGDFGHGVLYPAASPYAMGVGGTTLKLGQDGKYLSEKAWSATGGGLSSLEPEPLYQSTYPIPNNPDLKRGTPDVAYLADPATGVAVYDSIPFLGSAGWFQVGGTSAGAPQWAALAAITNSLRSAMGKAPLTGATTVKAVLYDAALKADGGFIDIEHGRDGKCGVPCRAKPAYDYVTGLGTPQANILIPDLRDLP